MRSRLLNVRVFDKLHSLLTTQFEHKIFKILLITNLPIKGN